MNCEERFSSGFPPQTRRLTTILHVKPTTMGLPRGSLKEPSIMNGRRRALSYGPTGIVRFFQSFPTPIADGLLLQRDLARAFFGG